MSAPATLSRLRVPGARAPLAAARPLAEVSAPKSAFSIAHLERLLYESFPTVLPAWAMRAAQDPLAYGFGGFGGVGTATGTPSDRKGGRDVPLVWSELDLRAYRVMARALCDSNQFAIGFLAHLTGYHIGKGFGWQACKKGAAKSPYPTTGAPQDPLVAKAQSILDQWRDLNLWPVKSQEAFVRWRRDGEVFGRFFTQGGGRLSVFRFVDPELVVSPTGATENGESFGLANEPGDVETVTRIYLLEPGQEAVGDWHDFPSRFVHARANVDSGVKRGITDFYAVHEDLEGVRRFLHRAIATAQKQVSTAWIEKYRTATLAQVQAELPEYAPTGTNALQPDRTSDIARAIAEQFGRFGIAGQSIADVRKVEGDREFQPGPVTNAGPLLEVQQAALRGCCARWGMPENFTGDASNNNYASLLAAGAPFTRLVECSQIKWSAWWERPIALKVLELARDAGLLTWQEWRQLDVEVTPPAVATPEPDKDATRIAGLIQSKVMCLDTARQQLGLDPQHEAEGVQKDAQSQQQQQQPPANDGGAGDPPGGIFGEARVSEEGQPPFPGAVFDRAKHRWVKGSAPSASDNRPQNVRNSSVTPGPTAAPDHAERRRKDAIAAEHVRTTAKEPPRPKHLEAATKYKDVARRRRIVAALKTEAELAEAVGGFNEPDSRPADVLYVEDEHGSRVTDPKQVRNALQLRDASVKIIQTGKVHRIEGGRVVPTDHDADEGYRQQAAEILSRRCEAFEVKTMLASPKDAVYMNPKAKRRKELYAKRYAVSFSVVAVDKRRGEKHSGHEVYVAPYKDVSKSASGTVKLDEMMKVASLKDVMGALS